MVAKYGVDDWVTLKGIPNTKGHILEVHTHQCGPGIVQVTYIVRLCTRKPLAFTKELYQVREMELEGLYDDEASKEKRC